MLDATTDAATTVAAPWNGGALHAGRRLAAGVRPTGVSLFLAMASGVWLAGQLSKGDRRIGSGRGVGSMAMMPGRGRGRAVQRGAIHATRGTLDSASPRLRLRLPLTLYGHPLDVSWRVTRRVSFASGASRVACRSPATAPEPAFYGAAGRPRPPSVTLEPRVLTLSWVWARRAPGGGCSQCEQPPPGAPPPGAFRLFSGTVIQHCCIC